MLTNYSFNTGIFNQDEFSNQQVISVCGFSMKHSMEFLHLNWHYNAAVYANTICLF